MKFRERSNTRAFRSTMSRHEGSERLQAQSLWVREIQGDRRRYAVGHVGRYGDRSTVE
jgi:hypothetical protein